MITDFERVLPKFLKFFRNKIGYCSFYETNIEKFMAKTILVPTDYGIYDIPLFKKYCKIIGFDIENEFFDDVDRTNGYRQYHVCIITPNENFMREYSLEEFYEED